MTTFKVLILLIISNGAFAFEYKKGEGSEFVMTTQGQRINLNIYVTDVSDHQMSVEMHFGTGGLCTSSLRWPLKAVVPLK